MDKVKIYFSDLSEEKQQELLRLYQAETPEDMNWNVFPVTIIEGPEPESETIELVDLSLPEDH